MAINRKFVIHVKIAWWFTWVYLPLFTQTVLFVTKYVNPEFQPNYENLKYWLSKASKVVKYNNQ